MPRHRPSFTRFLPWIFLVLLSLVALAASIQLYRIQREIDGFAVCRIAPGFDCAPALQSRYGRLFGIPLSSYSVAFYLFIFAVALQPLFRSRTSDRNAVVATALLSGATLFCAWLAWVSLTKLRAYCPFCLVLHVVTPIMLAIVLWPLSKRRHDIGDIMRHEFHTIAADKRVLTGVILAGLLVVIGLPVSHALARHRLLAAFPTYKQVLEGNYPRFDRLTELLGDRPFRGRADATVTIVEFADFTCPVCMQARTAIEDLMRVYDVKFIYVNYPRSRECNPLGEDNRPGSCLGALVSHYAAQRGADQFWRVYDSLFNAPGLLAENRSARLAELAGAPSMEVILADTAAQLALRRDLEIARQADVRQVPTFFINGMGIEGLPEDWFFVEAVEREQDRAASR